MRKNEPYKIIKQLLGQVHLKPRKKDWEQMQALLDKQMPVHRPVKWFNTSKHFLAGSIVVLVTAAVFIVKHEQASKLHQHTTPVQTNKVITGTDDKNENSDSHISTSPGGNVSTGNKDSLTKNFAGHDTAYTIIQRDKNNLNSTINSAPAHRAFDYSNTKTKKETGLDHKDLTGNRKNNPAGANTLQALTKMQPQDTKTGNDPGVADRSENNASTVINDKPVSSVLMPDTARKNIPGADTAAVLSTASKSDTAKSTIQLQSKTGKNKKGRSKNTVATNSSFNYGLQLSPLQYYTSPAAKKLGINLIPGIYGEYLFSKHAGVHIDFFPYQPENLDNNNILTSSSATNDTGYTTTNYINSLHTLKAGISFIYKVNNFSLEAGLGVQSALNGKGYIITTQHVDTFQVSQTKETVYYHRNDVPFYYVNKSTLFYHFNFLYNFGHWQAGTGYSQNIKAWTKDELAKPVGRIELQVRYNLAGFGKKK